MEKFISGRDLIDAGVNELELTGLSPKRQVGEVPAELQQRLDPLFIQHGLDPGKPIRFFVPWNRDGVIFSQ